MVVVENRNRVVWSNGCDPACVAGVPDASARISTLASSIPMPSVAAWPVAAVPKANADVNASVEATARAIRRRPAPRANCC